MATILVVEDDRSVRDMLRVALGRTGYAVLEAKNGQEAIEITHANHPDLILLDIMMPEVDGLQACTKLKSDPATRPIPIVFLTARAKPADLVQGFAAGGNDYVTKPIDLEELLARVEAHLRVKALHDALEREKTQVTELLEFTHTLVGIHRSSELFQTVVARTSGLLGGSCRFLVVEGDLLRARVVARSDAGEVPAETLNLRDAPGLVTALCGDGPGVLSGSALPPNLREACGVGPESQILLIPLLQDRTPIGALVVVRPTGDWQEADRQRAGALAEFAAVAFQNVRRLEETELANAALEKLSLMDELTDTYNRRFLFRRLAEEWERVRRHHHPLTCCLMDLDHFKQINDTHGHQVGDRVLKEFAWLVLGRIRKSDILARYGGEEFMLMLLETAIDGAKVRAERLRQGVEESSLGGLPVGHVTVSIGLAGIPGPAITSPDQLIAAADDALYQAKRGGRNRVVVSSGSAGGGAG